MVMQLLSGYLDSAYMAFLTSSINCCMPRKRKAPRPGAENPITVVDRQPRPVPPPAPELSERPATAGREWVTRTKSMASRASSRGSFAVRRRMNAYNGPRRAQIGPPRVPSPSDFRHVETAAKRRASWSGNFRPLVLSIHVPANKLSPLLPYFGGNEAAPSPSRFSMELPGHTAAFIHSRGESARSARAAQKSVRSGSGNPSESTPQFPSRVDSLRAQEFLAAWGGDPIPQTPPPARLRANTEPGSYERVKSALHEKYELEQRVKDLEETIEVKRSVCLKNRPSEGRVSNGASVGSASQEPMPSPTSLAPFHLTPPTAPSFLQQEPPPLAQHPVNSPPKPGYAPLQLAPFTKAAATFTTPPHSPASSRPSSQQGSVASQPAYFVPPPPPLPLILQQPPPVPGKRKSFSRVSGWLSRASGEHSRNMSFDSVTNNPRPVTSRDGFYQCFPLQPSRDAERGSVSTFSTLESESEMDELDEHAVPVAASPTWSASRVYTQDIMIRDPSTDSDGNQKSVGMTHVGTFGENELGTEEIWKIGAVPNLYECDHVGVAI
ncbi:hypothetical protein PZA11_001984 [Diplocarpon coronariae]